MLAMLYFQYQGSIPRVFSRIFMFSFVLCPSLVSVAVIIMMKGNLGKKKIYFSLKIIVNLWAL